MSPSSVPWAHPALAHLTMAPPPVPARPAAYTLVASATTCSHVPLNNVAGLVPHAPVAQLATSRWAFQKTIRGVHRDRFDVGLPGGEQTVASRCRRRWRSSAIWSVAPEVVQ